MTFTWQPVAGATEYKVSYYNGKIYNEGIFKSAAELNCASGTCSYSVYNLVAGASEWWVLSSNAAGESAWSNTGDFTVVPPKKPIAISPNYNVNVTGPVTFNWWPTAGTLEYKISINNAGTYNDGVFKRADQLNCSSGICSYTVNNLSTGASMWWILAKSSAGESGWSNTGNFSVLP